MRARGAALLLLSLLAASGAGADDADAPRRLYELADDSAVLVPRRLSDLAGRIDAGTHLVLLQLYSSGDERAARLAPHFAHVARALSPLVVFAAVDVRRRRRLAEEIAQRCETRKGPRAAKDAARERPSPPSPSLRSLHHHPASLHLPRHPCYCPRPPALACGT